MSFNHLSKDKIMEISRKGHEARRSPELKKAWADQDKIREIYVSGGRVADISRSYNIPRRQVYRILDITK